MTNKGNKLIKMHRAETKQKEVARVVNKTLK